MSDVHDLSPSKRAKGLQSSKGTPKLDDMTTAVLMPNTAMAPLTLEGTPPLGDGNTSWETGSDSLAQWIISDNEDSLGFCWD